MGASRPPTVRLVHDGDLVAIATGTFLAGMGAGWSLLTAGFMVTATVLGVL